MFFISIIYCNDFKHIEKEKSYPSYKIISDEFDEKIDSGYYIVEGKVVLTPNEKIVKNIKIQVQNQKIVLSKTGYFELKIAVATAYIAFNHKTIQEAYYENHSPKEKRRIKIIVYASKFSNESNVTVEKPVLYFYNSNPIEFNFNIQVDNLLFSYPKISSNQNYLFSTTENGTILDKKKHEFPYLFWESKQKDVQLNKTVNNEFSGEILKSENIISYLDSILNYLGFNSNERTDFITYWGPKLISYKYLFIQFLFQNECSQFATYSITPKPDNLNRFYLLFSGFEYYPENLKSQSQVFHPFKREGFNVLEWGGIELSNNKIYQNY